tara:strand:- start:785 stop:985 length:201 start_codon:yes stop_codon:yes gene_type:complete
MKNRQFKFKSCSSFFCFVVLAVLKHRGLSHLRIGDKKKTSAKTIWASPQHNTHLVLITEEEEEEEE